MDEAECVFTKSLADWWCLVCVVVYHNDEVGIEFYWMCSRFLFIFLIKNVIVFLPIGISFVLFRMLSFRRGPVTSCDKYLQRTTHLKWRKERNWNWLVLCERTKIYDNVEYFNHTRISVKLLLLLMQRKAGETQMKRHEYIINYFGTTAGTAPFFFQFCQFCFASFLFLCFVLCRWLIVFDTSLLLLLLLLLHVFCFHRHFYNISSKQSCNNWAYHFIICI